MPEKEGQWRPRLRDLVAETSKIMQVLRAWISPRPEKSQGKSTLWHHNRSLPYRKKALHKRREGRFIYKDEETVCAGLVTDHDCPYTAYLKGTMASKLKL